MSLDSCDIFYRCRKCWTDISEGLPSRFGFPIVVSPRDPDTIFVIPEEDAEARMTPGGFLGIFRSKNRGTTWERLTEGLPQHDSFAHVYRAAACADMLDPSGIYVGTQGGQVLASRNRATDGRRSSTGCRLCTRSRPRSSIVSVTRAVTRRAIACRILQS